MINGVPQGSVLGPLLIILYINNIGINITHSYFHLYADDMVIYSASTLDQALSNIQVEFNADRHILRDLKLVLVEIESWRSQTHAQLLLLMKLSKLITRIQGYIKQLYSRNKVFFFF